MRKCICGCCWADKEMMVGGTLETLIPLYSSCVRGQLLLETKISLVMDQETLLLNSDAKKFVSTFFYATPFPATGSRLDHREGCSHILQLCSPCCNLIISSSPRKLWNSFSASASPAMSSLRKMKDEYCWKSAVCFLCCSVRHYVNPSYFYHTFPIMYSGIWVII